MRRYHVVVEFSEPLGHARAFAHLSESQVKRHFTFPWTRRDVPLGPEHDVSAAEVSRLRIFRAASSDSDEFATEAFGESVGEDVTALFLPDTTARAPGLRPLLIAVGAVAGAALAMFGARKLGRSGTASRTNQPRISHG